MEDVLRRQDVDMGWLVGDISMTKGINLNTIFYGKLTGR